MNVKMRQLEGFVAAARHLSFSAAARELAMTQPAFSQLIRELENGLGVRLFERTTRKVALTEAGTRFLALVERPLEDLEAAYAYARDVAAGDRGRIAFALLPALAFGYAMPTLARFKAIHPNVSVRLVEGPNSNSLEMVRSREVDFAIGTLNDPDELLTFKELLVDEVLAVVSKKHPLAKNKRLTWPELAREELVLLTRRSNVRQTVDAAFARNGKIIEPAYEVANMVTALNLARHGIAVTFMPRIALSELNMRDLVSLPITNPRPIRRIGVITRTDRALSPAAAQYVDMLFSDAARPAYNAPAKRIQDKQP